MRKHLAAALCGLTVAVVQSGSAGVWLDDTLPGGAGGGSTGGESWSWISASPAPYSGSRAHQSSTASGLHGHSFNWATSTLSVNTGDSLYTYVYLDPANPVSEIMLSWCTTSGDWEHRAYLCGAKVWNIFIENGREHAKPIIADITRTLRP